MIRSGGQSTAEFAAGVAVLGVLVLGSITVAGLQEVQRRSIVAAREAAFQGMWHRLQGDVASLREQLARGHFDDAGLTNATGTSRLLQPDDMALSASRAGAPGRSAAAVRFMLTPLRAAGGFLGGGFDLGDDGFQSGVVSTNHRPTGRLPAPFDALQLKFEQPYAVLGDDWSASGPAHVAQRSGGLVPGHVLTPLSRVWQPLSTPLALFEPSLRELCLGLLEPDRVPEDRLGPGRQQEAPKCS